MDKHGYGEAAGSEVNAYFIPKEYRDSGAHWKCFRIPEMDGVARLFLVSAIFTEYDLFQF